MNGSGAPAVSVVIPLYNKGKYVERAISSVLAQTHQPLEIIVVDDGSTDDGPERVLHVRDPRISLLRQENRGPGAARNTGLAIAKGRYIAFLDADDEWFPAFLEKGVAVLEDDQAHVAAVWSGYLYYPPMTSNDSRARSLSGVYEIAPHTDLALLDSIMTYIWTCTAIIRTDIANKWGGFYEEEKCLLGEDKHLFLKIVYNERIAILNEPLAIYHTDASDLWGNKDGAILSLEPFLQNPKAILDACPVEKRHLMKEHLALWALRKARLYAIHGRKREASSLVERFLHHGSLSWYELWRLRGLVALSPILPWVAGIRHRGEKLPKYASR